MNSTLPAQSVFEGQVSPQSSNVYFTSSHLWSLGTSCKTKSIIFLLTRPPSLPCSPLQFTPTSNYLASQDRPLCLLLDSCFSSPSTPHMPLVLRCWLLHTPTYSLSYLFQSTSSTPPCPRHHHIPPGLLQQLFNLPAFSLPSAIYYLPTHQQSL